MKFIKCRKCGRYFRVTDNDYCLSKCTGCGSTDLEETIYKPINDSNIDWEQRRYEIAKMCVAAFVNRCGNVSDAGIRNSVKYADALIAELKVKSVI